ncbi:hypothetical protein DSECCO2_470700 [anaerobic digester metagenome]
MDIRNLRASGREEKSSCRSLTPATWIPSRPFSLLALAMARSRKDLPEPLSPQSTKGL